MNLGGVSVLANRFMLGDELGDASFVGGVAKVEVPGEGGDAVGEECGVEKRGGRNVGEF